MKKILLFLLSIHFFYSNAQINKKGTLKIKKELGANCLDVKISLTPFSTKKKYKDGDTLSFSYLFNNPMFVNPHVINCSKNLKYKVTYYEVSFNDNDKIANNDSVLNTGSMRLGDGGKLVIHNCAVKVTTENDSSQMVFIPKTTFYIVRDRWLGSYKILDK